MKTKTHKLLKKFDGPVCVVLGISTITGLSIVRSLGAKKVPVVGIDNSEFAIGAFSKYCSSAEVFSDKSALLSLLEEIGKSTSFKNVIFCEDDKYLLFVDRNKEYLENYFHLFSPQNVSLQQIINKKSMLRLAQEAGLDVPLTFFSDEHSLDEIKDNIPYPCFVKPLYTQSKERTKGEAVTDGKGLREVIDSSRFKNGYLIQENIKGAENNCWIYAGYVGKNIKAGSAYRKIRQIPKNFGVATIAISRENRKIETLAGEFLTFTGHIGFFDIEFKKDIRDGKHKFIEINPRICALNELIASSGIDLPYIAYCDAVGLPYQRDVKQRDGILWISIIDDFITCLKYYSKENKLIFFDWIRKVFKADSYAIFRLTDIRPFILKAFAHLLKIMHKGKKR